MYEYDTPLLEQELHKELEDGIFYPDSDGLPMSNNTAQFDCIVMITTGLHALLYDRKDVLVVGDLLWYPVKGKPEIRRAPDAMVVFGRPKGYRGSYRQWKEEDIAPHVVFEVLSPGNDTYEMEQKFAFYNTYGVEEYYVYDPLDGTLCGWQRIDGDLLPIEPMEGWVSPRLGIRFALEGTELVLFRPDGERFLTYEEQEQQRKQAEQQRKQAEQHYEQERAERLKAVLQYKQEQTERIKAVQQYEQEQTERIKAVQQYKQEQTERLKAVQQYEQEQAERLKAEQQMRLFAEKLREMGIDPDTLTS